MTDEVIELALSEFIEAVAGNDEATQQASFAFLPASVIAVALAKYVLLVEKQRDDARAMFRARVDVREVQILRDTVMRQRKKIEVQGGEIRQLILEASRKRKVA